MRLDAILRAHAFMKVERPPEIWEADTEDIRVLPLLGEMIAAPLSRGAALGELTLNVSNVVVESSADDEPPETPTVPPGDYVAVTVSGHADLGPDGAWHPGRPSTSRVLDGLDERLVVAGVRYAYVRRIPPVGSITIFLDRRPSRSTET